MAQLSNMEGDNGMLTLTVLSAIFTIASSAIVINKELNLSLGESIKKSLRKFIDENNELSSKEIDYLKRNDVSNTIEVIAKGIFPDLLETYKDKILECHEKHIDEIKDSNLSEERDKSESDASRCICEFLNRIKRHNKGLIEETNLNQFWEVYRCH
jgi:uncharacterized membrane protein YheB (UPF0754 family)